MALTADRKTFKRELNGDSFPVAADTRIFKGALVALNTSGYLVPASASSTLKVLGAAAEHVDNRTAVGTGGAGDLSCHVEYGVFRWDNSAGADEIDIGDVGARCYAVDDETVALTSDSNSRPPAGQIMAVDDAGVFVWHNPMFVVVGGGALLAANDLSDVNAAATARANIGANKLAVHLRVTDLVGSNAAVYRYVHRGPDATIESISSVLGEAALAAGDATITAAIDASAVTGGVVTITQSGSAAGDIDLAEPSAANVISEGEVLTLTVGGSNTDTDAIADVTVELSY